MKTYALSVAIIVLAISLLVSVFVFNSASVVGSVQHGGEYNYSYLANAGTTTAKTLAGTLGSVVIADIGTAGVIAFYATTSQATSSEDLMFIVDGAAIEGTYTYDVGFGGGLLIDHQAFDGVAVITYR